MGASGAATQSSGPQYVNMVVTPISTVLMRIKLMINIKKLQLLYPLQTQTYQNRWEKRHFAVCKFS